MMRRRSTEAMRFVTIGLSSTVLGLGVIFACWSLLKLPDLVANLIGYVVGFGWSFSWNRRWTFRSRAPVLRSFTAYLAVCGGAYMLNLGTVFIARLTIGNESFLPHIFGAVVYTTATFLTSRRFAFIEQE
jgi:putative flippase GtrA